MTRDASIDNLRSAITVAVVGHHAALAYTTFSQYNPAQYTASTAPVVDASRWIPLDYFVAWNDIFFMALMFLISGLFVGPSLARKAAGRFFTDRAKRLGIPFVVAVVVLMPLAYYPSWRLGSGVARRGFLLRFFTSDGWPAGPPWFLWLLLAFCGLAALAHWAAPRLWARLAWTAGSAGALAGVVLAVTLAVMVPVRLVVPPYAWFSLGGPLDFQTSRLLLYLAWFLLGVSLGGENLPRALSATNLRPWPIWIVVGMAAFAAHWTLSGGAFFGGIQDWAANIILAAVFSVCCAFTGLGSLGMFRALVGKSGPWAQSLAGNAYGIYVVHYAFVTWAQWGLLNMPFPAAVKFGITFVFALSMSWLITAMLRSTAARRIL